MTKKELNKQYKSLIAYTGMGGRCWAMLHEQFSNYAFCEANRKSFIAEYLLWEEFTEEANKIGFIYYCGIDIFLKEYKNAVYSCLNI